MAAGRTDRQGLRDAATMLPIAASLLLLPPLIRIFAAPAMLAGIPLVVVYIFAVWAAIILIAAIVAGRVGDQASGEPEGRPEAAEPH